MSETTNHLIGADGCPGGWIAVSETAGDIAARLIPDASTLLALPCRVLAIDIPIGLPDEGPRACDVAARQFLGRPRSASVFPAPVRTVLACRDHAAACAASERATGKKLSIQAWNLCPRIRDVDRWLRDHPRRRRRVHEVHPEVSFAAWNGGCAMTHSKRGAAGRSERLALVEQVFGAAYSRARGRFRRTDVADDDLLDAFALLWSARRIAAGSRRTLPDPPGRDRCGLPMSISY